jgi:predicted nicotinamide N-methyase
MSKFYFAYTLTFWFIRLSIVSSWNIPISDRLRMRRIPWTSLNNNHVRYFDQILAPDGSSMDIISRVVPLKDDWSVVIWEKRHLADTIDYYWSTQTRAVKDLDPFGLVNWPGSVVAAHELLSYKEHICNATVLILGAGTGLEAQAAAMLGAKQVIATDYNPTTLTLLEYAVNHANLRNVITSKIFDLFSSDPLPDCDILVASDLMYSERLATIVSNRIQEARQRKVPMKILVSDSQRFVDFLPRLRAQLGDDSLLWEERNLESFTGSGVMIDEDQTYEAKTRILAIGWN